MQRAIDDLAEISAVVTQRRASIFANALATKQDALRAAVEGRTILLTGGAGFIATQTLLQLLPFRPATVIVADSDENRMAELVRTLRSGGLIDPGTRLEPRLVDITTPLVARLLDEIDELHMCLQFAAAKHVRTERDPISLLRLLQVNLLGIVAVTEAVSSGFPDCTQFVVSTDKAADPSSFMGASKRLMEMAVLRAQPRATTTRFANVAFSNGSLLESWLMRLRLGQPLAVPADTWRYFVSPREAGQLCALAATAPPGSVVVPDEDVTGLVELSAALDRVLATEGLTAARVYDETDLEALRVPVNGYPVVVSPRDTAGEKQTEKFVGARETRGAWLPNVGIVTTDQDAGPVDGFMRWLGAAITDPGVPADLAEIGSRVGAAVPEFTHIPSGKRLDDRI